MVNEENLTFGPWLQLRHQLRHHMDIDVKDTGKTLAIILLIARFGAYGEMVI